MKGIYAAFIVLVLSASCALAGYMTLLGAGGPPAAAPSTTTLNPSDKAGTVTLSSGNLVMTNSGAGGVRSVASYSSAKKYYEVVFTTGIPSYDHAAGAANSSAVLTNGPGSPDTNSIAYYNGDPNIYAGGSLIASTGLTASAGDRVGVAIDMVNNKIWIRLNGGNWNNAAIGSQDPASNIGGISISSVSQPLYALGWGGASGDVNTFNFGGTAYVDTPPSGFGNW